MSSFDLATFGRCAFVGMVHLRALPGSPGFSGDLTAICAAAVADAKKLVEGGVDAFIVENMGDLPYLRGQVWPESVAAFAVAAARVAELGVPFGVQVLAGANREALGVAVAAGASFIRAEAFAYAHVADEGWLDASAGELLRARAALRSDVKIWADIQKKHAAHAVTADLSLADLAKGSAFSGADAVIVTGKATGEPSSERDVQLAKQGGLPVAVGSGVTPADATRLASIAQALIVGSSIKEDGDWRRPVDVARVRTLRAAIDAA